MAVRIVTDSTADLPPALAAELNITVVPLTVHFGQDSFRDGVDIDSATFFRKLTSSPELPHTSQPTPAAFEAVYKELLDQGHEVVSAHISAKLSGTYSSAVLAQAELTGKERVSLVDSQWVTMSLGLAVLDAARAAQKGAGLQDVLVTLNQSVAGLDLLLFCDTLEYLQRGGRIGKAAAFVGSLLSLKPVLTVRDGIVHPVDRVRTRSRALERLRQWARELSELRAFCVVHTASLPDAQALYEEMRALYPSAAPYLAEVGPVVATHVGPGAVGIAIAR